MKDTTNNMNDRRKYFKVRCRHEKPNISILILEMLTNDHREWCYFRFLFSNVKMFLIDNNSMHTNHFEQTREERERESCCNMSLWSSAIISFISWFFVFIDDNDNDDANGENENDDKNNYKQEFPHGRTLTLHFLLACKCERERDRRRKIQLANFSTIQNSSFTTIGWLNNHVGILISSFKVDIFAILRGFMFWHCLR
jgi:hypothetical protein